MFALFPNALHFFGLSLHQPSCNWNLELETRKVEPKFLLTLFILPFQITITFCPLARDLQLRWESHEPPIAPPKETMEFYPPISIGKLHNPFTLQRKSSVQAKVRFVSRVKRGNLEIRSQLLLFSLSREKRGVLSQPLGFYWNRPWAQSTWARQLHFNVLQRRTLLQQFHGPRRKAPFPLEDIPLLKECSTSGMLQWVTMGCTCVQFVLTKGPLRPLFHSTSTVKFYLHQIHNGSSRGSISKNLKATLWLYQKQTRKIQEPTSAQPRTPWVQHTPRHFW